MPGFDGTGPRGLGPMSGHGRGFCVLKAPQRPDEPVTGVAGGVNWLPGPDAELEQLRRQARHIEMILRTLRGRIERLKASPSGESTGA